MSSNEIHDAVRERYAAAAREAAAGAQPGIVGGCGEGGCCAPSEAVFGGALYEEADRGDLPETAVLASLGCGNPAAVAELREGEVVLDLGSGGGIDVLLSARRVGPAGRAYGLDMTEEMLALARRNAAEAGATNVEFLKGRIEEIPLPAETVDVVISNCVVNLSPDKGAVLAEAFRVLRAGGGSGSATWSPRIASPRPSAPSAATGPAASRARSRWASTASSSRRRASPRWTSTSPTRWPTACTARSSPRSSPSMPRASWRRPRPPGPRGRAAAEHRAGG